MSQSDFGGDGTVAAFKRVLACIALSITITGFAQSIGVLSQTNAAMSQSSSLRQNSYTNIAHALGKASPLFSAEYEPDIERHRLWLETIQSRMRFVGENDAYVQLSSIHVKDSGNAKIASAILDAAQRLVEETNADFEECENWINSLDVSPAMKRSILDAAVFFAFSNVTDDWSCYSKLVEKHRDILSMADKRESVALNVRMVRLLSEWNPVERGCIADRARCLEKTLFVSKCLDDEVLSISTTLFRCAEIVSAGKKLMTVALNLPDDEIKAYSALKYDEKHILRELDPDENAGCLPNVLIPAWFCHS